MKRREPPRYGLAETRIPDEIVAKNRAHAKERTRKARRVVAMRVGDRGKLRSERIVDLDRSSGFVATCNVAHPPRDRERQQRHRPACGEIVARGREQPLR